MLLSDLTFVIDKIQSGAICVLPTDTIYGLVATTTDPDAVERIYKIKGRSYSKPFIILISELSQLQAFSIEVNHDQISSINELWPGPVSIIFPCNDEAFKYLHRGCDSLAFRMPKQLWLRELIHKTGPIVATSANKSGIPISNDINHIMKQLPGVDLFIEGNVSETPSKLALISDNGSIEWVERG